MQEEFENILEVLGVTICTLMVCKLSLGDSLAATIFVKKGVDVGRKRVYIWLNVWTVK